MNVTLRENLAADGLFGGVYRGGLCAAIAGDYRAGHERQRFGLSAKHRIQLGFDQ